MWNLFRDILSVVVLLGAALGVIRGAYKCVRAFEKLREHAEDRKQESVLIIRGLMAALNGLEQLGANGPVTEAKQKIEFYVVERLKGD